jgi:haloalkane dehalogenase
MANPPELNISANFPFTLAHINILDSRIAYIDTTHTSGTLAVAVFLHGNPTSSYIWRNIIPCVSPKLRCIAPDLIGMGESGKPNIPYRFVDHARYLDDFLDAIVPHKKILLIGQDWGSALALHWASRHQDRVLGLVLMELIRPFPTWDDAMTGPGQEIFKAFRTPDVGRKLIIEDNLFVNAILPGGVLRGLSPIEQAHYEAPYLEERSREPVFRWPNELPIEGSPEDVYTIAKRYHQWMVDSDVPKLLLWAMPGVFVREKEVRWYMDNLKNLRSVFLGQGRHYLQEDHPHQIGSSISDLVDTLDLEMMI